MKCKIIGEKQTIQEPSEFTGEYAFTLWKRSYSRSALRKSKASLRKLSLTSFDFDAFKSKLAGMIQDFPSLASLELGGFGVIGDSFAHANLVKLDVSNLLIGPYAKELLYLMASGSAVPQGRDWKLPKLRHLSAPVCCSVSENSADILLLNSIEGCHFLPSSLQTLVLAWKFSLRVRGWHGPSAVKPFSQMLETSDCPMLRSICVQIDSPFEASNMSADQIRLLFAAGVARMFTVSPFLGEVSFEQSNGEVIVKWTRNALDPV